MRFFNSAFLIPGSILVLALLPAGPALAGTVETGDSMEERPSPNEGSEVEVSFNPTVGVTVMAGESIEQVYQRLADDINANHGDRFAAQVLTGGVLPQLEILRSNGDELDQLRFYENDSSMQFITLRLDMQGLAARINIGPENPSSGELTVQLNNRFVPVVTTGIPDAGALATAVLQSIESAGFEVFRTGNTILVTRDLVADTGLNLVGLRSTDPGLVTSDLALEASSAAGAQIPVLSTKSYGFFLLLFLIAGWIVLRRREFTSHA